MTEDQLLQLCIELGINKIDYGNRLLYKNYIAGHYYFDYSLRNYIVEVSGSKCHTDCYETVRKELIIVIKKIKYLEIEYKKLELERDFV